MTELETGRYLFEKAVSQTNLLSRRAYVACLIAMVISLVSVLINSNSISAEALTILGSSVVIKELLLLKINFTAVSAIAGFAAVVLIFEALSELFRISYYASIGMKEAQIYDGFADYSKKLGIYSKIESFVYLGFSVSFIIVVFIMPVSSFFYFLQN